MGFSPSTIYTGEFFDGAACQQGKVHAATVAAALHRRYQPASVFDFGCGQGALLGAFFDLGVSATAGCEGSVHGVLRCPATACVFLADLKRPVALNRTYDLVTCIEVAEHLPARHAGVLVNSIAQAARSIVIFSASAPDEVGDDHINLKPSSYWASLFSEAGFAWLEA